MGHTEDIPGEELLTAGSRQELTALPEKMQSLLDGQPHAISADFVTKDRVSTSASGRCFQDNGQTVCVFVPTSTREPRLLRILESIPDVLLELESRGPLSTCVRLGRTGIGLLEAGPVGQDALGRDA